MDKNLKSKINETIRHIFKDVDLSLLSVYQKRQTIFSYLCGCLKYDFDLLDPDQAYLNYLCRDKIYILPNGWNKEPMELPCEGKKNIVHYALYKKPWQYDDVMDGEEFWRYARQSAFYEKILENKAAFNDAEKAKKEAAAQEILEHAKEIVVSDQTFSKTLSRG